MKLLGAMACAALATALVAGCGSSDSTPSGSGPGAGPVCYDGSGARTSTCAVSPSGNTCSMGDANACVPLTTVEVYAPSAAKGACLHLVYTNDCGQEIYADTCIEHSASTDAGPASWQCWTSSILPGDVIDVSQCDATGRYFFVSTTSSGKLTVYESSCPAPTP